MPLEASMQGAEQSLCLSSSLAALSLSDPGSLVVLVGLQRAELEEAQGFWPPWYLEGFYPICLLGCWPPNSHCSILPGVSLHSLLCHWEAQVPRHQCSQSQCCALPSCGCLCLSCTLNEPSLKPTGAFRLQFAGITYRPQAVSAIFSSYLLQMF